MKDSNIKNRIEIKRKKDRDSIECETGKVKKTELKKERWVVIMVEVARMLLG